MRDSRRHICDAAIAIVISFTSSLYVGCAGPGSTKSQQLVTSSTSNPASATPYEKDLDIDLSSSALISPDATFTISNQGTNSVVMPTVITKGNSALNRSSILYPLQSLVDEQFALATWQFVINHNQHYCEAGAPGDQDQVATEPMRLLNGFGFTCCDQSSTILSWLWQGAGYQSRVVLMDFHGVPEIYYQGRWHMFDGDHRVYYLAEDNQTVASVADVIADPNLVARTADANGNDPGGFSAQWMADQYAASTPTYVTSDFSIAQTYSLQPGQSYSIKSGNIVPIFQGAFWEPSIPPAATGSFDWSLDYSNPNWSSLPSAQSGVAPAIINSTIFLTNTAQDPGFVVYALSSPFPVISLQVSGLVNLTSPNAAVNAYFSTDDASWSPAFPFNATLGSPSTATVDLSSLAAGQYTYFIKLELAGDGIYTAQIANVHILSEFQDSVYVFPNLIPGQVNHLTYQDWSPATSEHNVTVSLTGQ